MFNKNYLDNAKESTYRLTTGNVICGDISNALRCRRNSTKLQEHKKNQTLNTHNIFNTNNLLTLKEEIAFLKECKNAIKPVDEWRKMYKELVYF